MRRGEPPSRSISTTSRCRRRRRQPKRAAGPGRTPPLVRSEGRGARMAPRGRRGCSDRRPRDRRPRQVVLRDHDRGRCCASRAGARTRGSTVRGGQPATGPQRSGRGRGGGTIDFPSRITPERYGRFGSTRSPNRARVRARSTTRSSSSRRGSTRGCSSPPRSAAMSTWTRGGRVSSTRRSRRREWASGAHMRFGTPSRARALRRDQRVRALEVDGDERRDDRPAIRPSRARRRGRNPRSARSGRQS